MSKQLKIVFRNGAVVVAPYSSKFYTDLSEKIGKDETAEHPSAIIKTKDVQAVIFENLPDPIVENLK